MKTTNPFRRQLVAVSLAALLAACTMKDSEAPDFAGPSEFGTSINVSITPDVITQDGASQSVVTVTVRGPNGQLLPNVPLRAEILVNGTPVDFGSLSARNIVTSSEGKATLVYTAPAGVSGVSVDEGTIVDIGVTPVGSDFNASRMLTASLRLVPRGTIVVPANLNAAFTISPEDPAERQTVLFDASTSTSPANNPIASYLWDFGDGTTGTGRATSHAYSRGGTYVVTLTISDSVGRAAQATRSIIVAASAAPSANFVFSPTAPTPGSVVTFNGLTSTAAPGRTIVAYTWDFGDPADRTPGSGPQPTHRFVTAATYNVTLTVTDDLGRTSSRTQSVAVAVP